MARKVLAKNEPQEEKKEEQKKRKFPIILMLILALLAGGGLAFVGLMFFGPQQNSQAPPPPPEYETLDFGGKVINLSGGGYLRVNLVLEFVKNETMAQEIEEKQPKLLEELVNYFRSKTTEDVIPVGAQGKLKRDIKERFNKHLEKGQIEDIYFTDFLVQ